MAYFLPVSEVATRVAKLAHPLIDNRLVVLPDLHRHSERPGNVHLNTYSGISTLSFHSNVGGYA